MSNRILVIPTLLVISLAVPTVPAAEPRLPTIDGSWWQVAGDPDLGKYTSERQQPVDFAIWQAADGYWQIWSCIRHTKCGGTHDCSIAGRGQRLRTGIGGRWGLRWRRTRHWERR